MFSKFAEGIIDYQKFDQCLLAETEFLETLFIDQLFAERELEAGAEIEFFLLDSQYNPAPDNLKFIKLVNQPYLICEAGVAHLEINTPHKRLFGDCLSALHHHILKNWQYCCSIAQQHQYHLALIGTLITAPEKYQHHSYLTDARRYLILERCFKEHRANKPLILRLPTREKGILELHPESLAIIGLISAFQIHIQIGFSQSVRFYNIAQAIAAPMLILSANSPFLFGHELLSDSRIDIFEQSTSLQRFDRATNFKCCFFGTGYLKDSFFELFDQNYHFFPRLLPEIFEDQPIEELFHVRRQNGIVYRWNRPIVDFNEQGQPHLRIEYRGLSTGPTIIDMMATAAFFYGLIYYYAIQETPIEYLLPFHLARKNFFNAAHGDYDTSLRWFMGKEIRVQDLLKESLPLARKGLAGLGISLADINFYLDIIEKRIDCKRNGSIWQRKFVEKYGKNFNEVMYAYLQNQYQELPISEWKIG